MDLIVRPAEIRDIARIMEIINYEILNSTAVYDYEERTYEDQLKWFEKKKEEAMPVIVAENETGVVGYGTFGIFRPWAGYKYSLEHSIYVSKEVRTHGIGKSLMAKLIASAKETGYHTLIAGVDGSNKASIRFHKRFGFKEVGTLKEAGFKFGKWLDLTFLQLILE